MFILCLIELHLYLNPLLKVSHIGVVRESKVGKFSRVPLCPMEVNNYLSFISVIITTALFFLFKRILMLKITPTYNSVRIYYVFISRRLNI